MMAPPEGQSAWAALLPLVLMVAIFYFLLIAPVRRRQKRQEEMIASLKTGDRVITSGGLCGTVVGIKDDRISLRIAPKVSVEVTKSSVVGLDEES